KTKWIAAEEAAIIATLLGQKAAGNASDAGFKPMVWKIVVDDLADVITLSVGMYIFQTVLCCPDFAQFKGEYKVVIILRGLSGFGWDEGMQCVTAPLEVWNKYLI
ncbi:hypothetical protein K439DRAFT_1280245, partial [Ramaria rubella]